MKTDNSLPYIIDKIEQFYKICEQRMHEGYVCKTTLLHDGKGIIGYATFYKPQGNNMPNLFKPELNKICLRTG